jgi:hypothetical protein
VGTARREGRGTQVCVYRPMPQAMLTYAYVCLRMLTYAYVCSRMLTCAYVCTVCMLCVCVCRLMPHAMGGGGMNPMAMMLTYALCVYALSLCACSVCVCMLCACVSALCVYTYVLCVCAQADAAGNGGCRHESYGDDGQDDGRCHAGVSL